MSLAHRKVVLVITTLMGMPVALNSPTAVAVPPWTEQASIAVGGTTAAVDGNLAAFGTSTSISVYRRGANGVLTQEAILPAGRQSFSIAVDSDPFLGELVIIGDMRDRVGIVEGGAVFIYASNGSGNWSLQTTLRPASLEAGDQFGRQLAFDGQTLAVSAPGDDAGGTDAGTVYVFERGPGWPQRDRILPPAGRGNIEYGFAVDVSGDRLVVGAQRDDSVATDAGTAFVYGRQADQSWMQLTELAGTGLAANFFFGRSVAVEGNTVVVGAPGTGAIAADPRSAYVFVENGNWSQQTILQPPQFAAGGGQFGGSVDISGETVVVGAFRGNSLGFGSGSVWAFGRNGAIWNLEQEMTASDGAENAWYGFSVAIDGATVVAVAALARASYVNVGGDYVFQAPPQAEVSVRAIEVTQAVQDWNNTVTLIQGKTTVVRAFVELLPGEAFRRISAELRGTRGAQPLTGSPLSPVNGTINSSVNIAMDIESRRGRLQDSLKLQPAR